MQTKVIGGGVVNPGVELAIDPTFQAARVSLRPLEYAQFGQILGHYRVTITTSAALWSANAILASVRWADASRYMVLNRLMSGITVVTAITAQRTDPLVMNVQRSYTVNESVNATAIALSGNNQKMRTIMGSSLVTQMAVASAAAGISGGTRTPDANSSAQLNVTGLGAIGTGVPTTEMYAWEAFGQHPFVFGANEGFTVAWGPTALASGTATVTFTLSWAEVVVF